MKEPRVSDFDPKAPPPLKSSLDDMPTIAPSPQRSKAILPEVPIEKRVEDQRDADVSTPEVPPVPPPESPPARTPVRIKRTITRYAFEFFQDQVERLKQFSLEEQLRGEKGSMSQMVREALDMYIAKRKRTEE